MIGLFWGSSGVKFEITLSLVQAHLFLIQDPTDRRFPIRTLRRHLEHPSPANSLLCVSIFGLAATNPHLPGSDTKALPRPYLKLRRRVVDGVDDHLNEG